MVETRLLGSFICCSPSDSVSTTESNALADSVTSNKWKVTTDHSSARQRHDNRSQRTDWGWRRMDGETSVGGWLQHEAYFDEPRSLEPVLRPNEQLISVYTPHR